MLFQLNSFGQTSKEILLSNNWKNSLGNTFNFSDTLLTFDGIAKRLNEFYLDVTITDTSFLCFYTQDFNNHNSDTMFYFEYKANEDSLTMSFKPNWFKLEKGIYSDCSFSNFGFCKLVNKKLLFFSESYLKRTNRDFEFEYYESQNGNLYIKLFNNGDFIFSTSNNAIPIPEKGGEYQFPRRYRTFNGVYEGQLSNENMNIIKYHLFQTKEGVQSYLHTSTSINKNDEHYFIVKGRDGIFSSSNTLAIILQIIAFETNDINYKGLSGDKKSKLALIFPKNNVLIPKDYYNNFNSGLYAIKADIEFVTEIKVNDSVNYLYNLKIQKFLAKVDEDIDIKSSIPLISPFKIVSDSIGYLYSKRTASYLDNKKVHKSADYVLLEDIFSLKNHYIFEYIDYTDYSKTNRMEITRTASKAIRNTNFYKLFGRKFNSNYSKMDKKIAKAIRAF